MRSFQGEGQTIVPDRHGLTESVRSSWKGGGCEWGVADELSYLPVPLPLRAEKFVPLVRPPSGASTDTATVLARQPSKGCARGQQRSSLSDTPSCTCGDYV